MNLFVLKQNLEVLKYSPNFPCYIYIVIYPEHRKSNIPIITPAVAAIAPLP